MRELTLEEACKIYAEITGSEWIVSTGINLISKVYYLVEVCIENTGEKYGNVYTVKEAADELSEELEIEIKIKLPNRPEGMEKDK